MKSFQGLSINDVSHIFEINDPLIDVGATFLKPPNRLVRTWVTYPISPLSAESFMDGPLPGLSKLLKSRVMTTL